MIAKQEACAFARQAFEPRGASARDSRHPECRATSGQAHSKINRAGSELRLLEFVSTIAALYLLVSLSRHLVSVRLGLVAGGISWPESIAKLRAASGQLPGDRGRRPGDATPTRGKTEAVLCG